MGEALATRPAHVWANPTPDGHVMVVTIDADSLDSAVIRLTPANAARLGQQLIDVAASVELP